MSAQTWDWVAVALAVGFAAAWLGFRLRRQWRSRKESPGGVGGCGATCEGCPYRNGCGARK